MKSVKYIVTTVVFLFMSFSILSAKVEKWTNFTDKTNIQTPNALSQIVIVRPQSITGKAINIYVDGEYVTSLLPGAYTQELICPGKHRIQAAYTNILNRYKEKSMGGEYVVFQRGKAHLFRIVKQAGKLILEGIPDSKVMDTLKHYSKKQSHTISRLNKSKCTQPSKITGKGK